MKIFSDEVAYLWAEAKAELEIRLRPCRGVLWAMMFCILGQCADVFSSMTLRIGTGFYESNPFARHSDGSFWPAHAVVQEALIFLLCAVFASFIWKIVKPFGNRVVNIAAALPFVYWGWESLYGGGLNNFLIWIGFYRTGPGF